MTGGVPKFAKQCRSGQGGQIFRNRVIIIYPPTKGGLEVCVFIFSFTFLDATLVTKTMCTQNLVHILLYGGSHSSGDVCFYGQPLDRVWRRAGHKRVWGLRIQTIKWGLVLKPWMRAFSQQPRNRLDIFLPFQFPRKCGEE